MDRAKQGSEGGGASLEPETKAKQARSGREASVGAMSGGMDRTS